MTIFRNTKFTKRDYECTNIVACVAEEAPNENYVLDLKFSIANLTHLFTQSGVRYYGFL